MLVPLNRPFCSVFGCPFRALIFVLVVHLYRYTVQGPARVRGRAGGIFIPKGLLPIPPPGRAVTAHRNRPAAHLQAPRQGALVQNPRESI